MSAISAAGGAGITMSRLLAEGAEGGIYELLARPGLVAKVYHHPVQPALRRKLEAMIRLRSPELDEIAAWPIELLHQEGRDGRACVGFLMPRVRAPGDLDRLSHPAQQRAVFPEIDYGFLLRVARNLMRAGAILHRAGCVIGDVNQSNVRVLRDGSIRFADVDSFQLADRGEVFPCVVGTGIYTPPELHGPSFASAERTPNHDGFGLAVLVFELLMAGRHPFAGVPADGRARSIEEAIRDGLYAYGHLPMKPPPGSVGPEGLGELAGLFDRAFTSTDRPSAQEWVGALERAEAALRPCPRNPRHRLMLKGPCPWCAAPSDPLPAPESAAASASPAPAIADAIAAAERLPRLTDLARRCRVAPLKPEETLVPPVRRLSGGAIAGSATGALGLALLLFTWAGIGLILASAPVVLLAQRKHGERLRRLAPLRDGALRAMDEVLEAEERVRTLDAAARRALDPLRDAAALPHRALTAREQRLAADLAGADESFLQYRLAEHLRTRLIARAAIPGVGVSWRAMLASFGIETAADVSPDSLRAVPALRAELISELLAWRLGSEQSLSRGPAGAPSAWKAELRRRHDRWVAETSAQLLEAAEAYRSTLDGWEKQLAEAAAHADKARRACRLALALLRTPPAHARPGRAVATAAPGAPGAPGARVEPAPGAESKR